MFLADAVHQGYSFGRRLVDPYAGYMHLVPRMLAEIASHLPLQWAALVMSGGAVAIVALLALFVYRASATAIPLPSLRVALAGAMVLLPVANAEPLASAANLHWFFIFAAFWAFIWVPRGSIGRLVSAAIVGMAALSDPQTILLAPLAVARVLAIRSWRDHLVTIALIGGALVQCGVVFAAPYLGAGSRVTYGADVYSLVEIFGTYAVAVNIAGVPLAERFWGSIWAVVPWVGVAAFVAFTLYALHRPPSRLRSLALICLGMSVVYFIVAFWINGTVEVGPTWSFDRPRYLIIPSLMLLSSFMLIVSELASRVDRGRTPIVMIVLVWYTAVAAMSLTYPNNRTNGPAWASALAQARQACPAGATIEVPIPPAGAGLVVKLDCQDLGP
jgi:hypothetical protein